MTKEQFPFERIYHGMRQDGTRWQATVLSKYLVPDYDLIYCSREELEMRYPWRIIAMSVYIKMHAEETGEYVLDLRSKEILRKE